MTAGSYNYYGSTFDFNSIMLYDSRAYGITVIDDVEIYTQYIKSLLFSAPFPGSTGYHTAITIKKKDGTLFQASANISPTDKNVICQIYNY
jgi:hypothetical protein